MARDVGTKGVARAQRRAQLVDVAVAELGRRGYAGASVEGLARTAGVSKAMVYHLFGSKEGLVVACLEEVGPAVVDAVAGAQTAVDPGRRAQDTLVAIFEALGDHRFAWALVYDHTLPPGSAAAVLAAEYRSRLEGLGTVGVGEVLAAAGVDDPLDHELLDRLWQSAVATTVRWWQGHEELTAVEMAERCSRVLAVVTGGAAADRPHPFASA